MKTLLSVLLGLCVAALSLAQSTTELGTPKRTPEDLRKLLAPIALYPDALVALILPAATNSSDLVLAARFQASASDPKEIENQPWDDSVKSLARYPELIKWMDENLVWTREVGEAFAAQPADVMSTMQSLRKEAQAAGLLTNTPQQRVVVQDEEVTIVPAQEDMIYVPEYDPEVLILHRPVVGPWLSFGAGFAVGSWLNFDCDWRTRRVVIFNRPPGWTYRPDWRWHDRDRSRIVVHEWHPTPGYWQHLRDQPHHDYRPVPVVQSPHFGDRRDDQRRWDGRHDEQRNGNSANDRIQAQRDHASEHRTVRPDITGANLPPPVVDNPSNIDHRGGGVRPGYSGGSVGRIDNHVTPPAVAAPPAPVAGTVPSASPAPSGTQSWHQIQEHRLGHPVDPGTQRTYPHQVNNPPAQHASAPSEARVAPQGPAPQRIGGFNQRGGGAPPPESHSAPVVRQAAPPPPAPAPAAAAVSPGRDERGGGNNNNNNAQPNGREAQRVLR